MQQKYSANNQPDKLNVGDGEQAIGHSLGELDRVILENTFADRDSLEEVDFKTTSNFVPQKALYIGEIDSNFYFLDYSKGNFQPQPQPIEASSLASPKFLTTAKTKSNSNLAKIANDTDNSFLSGKKSLFIGVGLGILLTLGGTRLFLTPSASNQGDSQLPSAAQPNTSAQAVTITNVETSSINSTLDSSGTVAAYERVPVMSQASGLQITEILAERGDYVERGQVLARLNNRALKAQEIEAEADVAQQRAALAELQAGSRVEEIAQAEARVANARSAVTQAESDLDLVQKRVERNRSLQAEGAISRDRFDEVLNQERVARSGLSGATAQLNEAQQALAQLRAGSRPQAIARAKAQLEQAQGRLQAIEAQLADTTITAPASGIIASREAKIGQITSASEMLFSIIQNGRLELRLKIPETLVGKVKPGQKVRISSNADANLQLTGEVREIEPTIDDASRQALVKVDLPSDNKLKPGMFLQASINTDTNPGLAVPIESLLPQSGDRAIAFVLQGDNTVKAQTVEMGKIIDEERVEVISGLESGDRIILKGAAYLKDGDRVTVGKK